jgi:hypothetical protein
VEQRVLVTAKDAIYFMKNLGEILASQTFRRKCRRRTKPAPLVIDRVALWADRAVMQLLLTLVRI